MNMLEHERNERNVPTRDTREDDQAARTNTTRKSRNALEAGLETQIEVLRRFVKNSGFYAISSLAVPLVSLVLAPFLTHYLSPADYGMLTILNTFISLAGIVTQLGLGSAFFRAC